MQETISLMVVDQDPLTLAKVTEAMKEYDSEVTACSSLKAMLDALCQNWVVDVIIINLERPFEPAFDLLPQIKARSDHSEIVFISRFADESLWVEAIQCGAYDLLPRHVDTSELKRILLQAVEKHRPMMLRKARFLTKGQ